MRFWFRSLSLSFFAFPPKESKINKKVNTTFFVRSLFFVYYFISLFFFLDFFFVFVFSLVSLAVLFAALRQ